MPAMSTAYSAAIAGAAVSTAARDAVLFENAPPVAVQRWVGLVKPGEFNVKRRALLFVLIGWAPLILLAMVQSVASRSDDLTPLLWQVGVHARYLVAVPLLVLAEGICAPQLNAIVQHFVTSGMVDERDRGRFGAAVASTRRLLQSRTAEAVVLVLTYLIVLAAMLSHPVDELPPWVGPNGTMPMYSPAGWWHALVSLPLLLALIFGWLWRLLLWARLLWLASRLRLRLVAAHPDHCAGLAFLGQSVRAFAIVALAVAAIVAGRSAYLVIGGAGLPTPNIYFNIGLMVVVMVLLVAPLAIFTPMLMQVWRRGTFEYGALADRVGQSFEQKWLHGGKAEPSALERARLLDHHRSLFGGGERPSHPKFVPVGVKDLAALAGAMLLPFVPVVLLAFPLDVIWSHLKGLLL